jgi:methyl-accepting chemotaxis protein
MSLFEPGMRLLNSLCFARKFQLILVVLTLPLIYSAVVIYNDKSKIMSATDQQLKGIEFVSVLHPLRILAAKHRGNSAQWLAGNEGALSQIKRLETEMSESLAMAQDKIANFKFSADITNEFDQLKGSWSKLLSGRLTELGAQKSFDNHSEWITNVTHVIDLISGESGLLLDTNIDTYMLMQMVTFDVPAMQEYLGQLRGLGAAVATQGRFSPQSFIAVSTLDDTIMQTWEKLEGHNRYIKMHNSKVAGELSESFNQAKSSMLSFEKMTKEKLVDPDRPEVSGSEYFAAGTKAITEMAEFYDAILNAYVTGVTGNRNEIKFQLTFALGVFALLVLLGGYLFTALKKSLDNNIHITQEMAKCLEDGNLSCEFKSRSQDELGLTVHSLNNAFQQIRKVVSQVRDNSSGLTKSSTELQTVSNDVNNLGESQKHKVAIIVTAATQLAATAKEVASHCENASQETTAAKDKSSGGAARSQASANIIRELAESIRKAGDEISELAQQAASISTVIDVIKAIAEQTNLLALNAAIEAARAGEQGRGFAVVADEVRTLANRTQESTNEIETTISNLQSVAEQAVSAMKSACDQADSGESEAIQTGEALAEIERSVNLVSDLIMQVAAAGDQQAGAAEEIAQNIQDVDNASSNLVERAKNVASVAGEVGTDSLELDDTVKKFQV